MTTNLEVMLKAKHEIKKMRKRLKKNISKNEREVLMESIALTQIIKNQSLDAIRSGKI